MTKQSDEVYINPMTLPIIKMTFADVVGFVCKYPESYTMFGTFPEVVAYLEGWTTADSRKNSRQELHAFSRWMSAKFGYSNSTVASKYLRDSYPVDSEAIREFARLYREFASTISSETAPLPGDG
jgi:hypothetical protein